MDAERIDEDHFRCPMCGGIVTITYWKDSRGKHPNDGLKCDRCKSVYGIALTF